MTSTLIKCGTPRALRRARIKVGTSDCRRQMYMCILKASATAQMSVRAREFGRSHTSLSALSSEATAISVTTFSSKMMS